MVWSGQSNKFNFFWIVGPIRIIKELLLETAGVQIAANNGRRLQVYINGKDFEVLGTSF